MEQACLMTVAFGSVRNVAVSVQEAIRYVFERALAVLELAISARPSVHSSMSGSFSAHTLKPVDPQ